MRSLTARERILLHLFDLNRFADDYEAPPEASQEGVAQATGIRVQHVMQSLRPLIQGELVDERTSHVKRQVRRRKVYFLTPNGRHQVASLRSTLFDEVVPFRKGTGEVAAVQLAKVYHEERRGSTLLQLVAEANTRGAVSQVAEVEIGPPPDFTQEVPTVERFYGRTKELADVLRSVDATPIVVVTGFAGIGKTTLGAKVCETVKGKRAVFWRRIRPWDIASDLAARIASFLKVQGRTSLHNLQSLPEAKELSRVEEHLAADLAGLPALLIFDDIQDASPEAESFLSLLARVVRTQKGPTVLFLSRAGLRSISQREVVVEGSVSELPLGGLDRKSSAAMLSDAGVPTPLIRPFAEASGGNPLFLQLFARTPHQEGVGKGWNTVATYIAEQIEPSLDSAERDCLEAASLYDVPVPPPALLLEGRAAMKTLVGLQRKGLLGQAGTGQYVLHDTLKEFFRGSLGADRRAHLAGKIVAWLRQQAEEAAGRGEPQEAVGYLSNAAKLEHDRAKWAAIMERVGEMRLFMGHYVAAERAFQSVLAEATDARAQAHLHFLIATALNWNVLPLDDADREVAAGLAILPREPTPERAELLIRRARIAISRRDFVLAAEAAREAVEIADRGPLGEEVRARARLTRAQVRLFAGDPFDFAAAETDFRSAADVFRKTRNEFLVSVTEGALATAMYRAGQIEEGLRQEEALETHVRASPHRWNVAEFLRGRALALAEYRGDFDRADALLQEKMKRAKEDGALFQFLETHLDYAHLLRYQGRYEEARESLGYFLKATAEGILYQLSTSWWLGGRLADLSLMVRLCARSGDTASGEAYLRQIRSLANDRPPETSAFDLAWAEAALLAAKGDFDKAEASYGRALTRPPPFMLQRMAATDEPRAECLLDFGRFLASRKDRDGARKVLEEAQEIFSRRLMKSFHGEALAVLGSLES